MYNYEKWMFIVSLILAKIIFYYEYWMYKQIKLHVIY